HQDGGSSGRPRSLPAVNLLRTVLSATNAAESPTALLARREMQSWKVLQLDPSSLRRPDDFTAPTSLGSDGSHLASTLYQLIRYEDRPSSNGHQKNQERISGIQGHVANRLSELIDDVRCVNVDRDDKRELLTLMVTGRDGASYPARALSEGTLRFLALAILELDPEARGVICLEEPENGINPPKIPAMLTLLQDIATDVNEPVEADNPLRQVIVNTHSPSVVAQVPDDCLLIAELKETIKDGRRFNRVSFSYLEKTWRHLRLQEDEKPNIISKGKLLAYLNPVSQVPVDGNGDVEQSPTPKRRRVVDREDLQILLPFTDESEELSRWK
ncbi:MAG: AAA family ATPase, partial [Armatimonadetes bacterium]|nr:AAA family ATPase [Armatimonadota bacterium]